MVQPLGLPAFGGSPLSTANIFSTPQIKQAIENNKPSRSLSIFPNITPLERPEVSIDTTHSYRNTETPIRNAQVGGQPQQITPQVQQTTPSPGKYFANVTADEEQQIITMVKEKYKDLTPKEQAQKFKEIATNISQKRGQKQDDRGFFGDVASALQERGKSIVENAQGFEASRAKAVEEEGVIGGIKKAFEVPREAVQVLGDVAGAAGDVLGLGMNEVLGMLPSFVKEGAKDLAVKVAKNPVVQKGLVELGKGIEQYKSRAQENPETAKTLESAYNIGELYFNLVGGKVVTKGAKATLDVAGDAASAGGKAIASGVEGATSNILGLTTGTSPETIRAALKSAGKEEFVNAMRGTTTDTEILDKVWNAAQNLKESNSKLYGDAYKTIVDSTAVIDPKGTAQPVFDLLTDKAGYGIKATTDDAGRITLDFSQSKIGKNSPQQKILQDIVDELQDRKDTSPLGMDTLRKRIDDYYVGTNEYKKSDAIVTMLRGKIGDKITEVVPEYASMNKKYSELTNLLNDIKGSLSLRDGNMTSSAITKLKGALRRNNEFRQAMIKELEAYSNEDLMAMLAGNALNTYVPRGLVGVAAGVGAGIGAFTLTPSFLVGLAASSPRVIGEMANAIGIGAQKLRALLDKVKGAISTASKNNPLSGTPLNDIPIDISTVASDIRSGSTE